MTAQLQARHQAHASWQSQLADAYDSVDALVQAGLLSARDAAKLGPAGRRYQLRVTRYYASLFAPADISPCPIRLQALPSVAEEDPLLPPWAQAWSTTAFGRPTPWSADPIGDLDRLAVPRLTHRYANRVLLHASPVCALYCRFCFRKSHLNDKERALYGGSLTPALDYVRRDPSIREVILTGGDPLSAPDARLRSVLRDLDSIAHVATVRIHTRVPVTLPDRLTADLLDILATTRARVMLVASFNHARELTPLALAKLDAARRRGIGLYNQSVLLRGVNDSTEALGDLFHGLYDAGVTPFYLHHPDWTPGTFHFRLPLARGRALMTSLAGRLPGPAVPHYVLDMPGGTGKVNLMSDAIALEESHDDGALGGALHRVRTPSTRSGQARERWYFEMWPSHRMDDGIQPPR